MLNYRHLHYVWVVTKEGGFARAAERLDMPVQDISAQVRELEKERFPQGLNDLPVLRPTGHSALRQTLEIHVIRSRRGQQHPLAVQVKAAARP